jgi:phosphoribosyl 1,2-cyclic phosphate phosphodiesterase
MVETTLPWATSDATTAIMSVVAPWMPSSDAVAQDYPADADWTFVITGCGTSHGNPPWGRRDMWSDDPRDQRRRSGALLKGPAGQVILFDVGPDLAHQLRDPRVRWDGRSFPEDGIERADAVLLTHDHADHSHGINDLRHVNRLMRHAGCTTSIPIMGWPGHLTALRSMFPFCFGVGEEFYQLAAPALTCRELVDDVTVHVAGAQVTPFAMSHGSAGRTTGFRVGDLAYLTDLKVLPLEADRLLQGLDLLVLDLLRDEPHVTHLCWAEGMAIIERLKPRRTVLIHMGHEVRWSAWESRFGPTLTMAVDGWCTRVAAGRMPRIP